MCLPIIPLWEHPNEPVAKVGLVTIIGPDATTWWRTQIPGLEMTLAQVGLIWKLPQRDNREAQQEAPTEG